ncbi:hypothetical protein [Luteimicrobium album]|uniref:hypothetical protein n=1 Tax=Luteimicrobium album TaxID=1054550 RepID=UPI003D67DD9C
MDLDALTAVRADQWARLDELARSRRLDGAEADELARLYQAVATDLSTIRSTAPDPTAVANLSASLSRARARLAGAHEPAWSDVVRFAVVSAPAALYRIRWWIAGVAFASVAVAVVVGWWVATDPGALASSARNPRATSTSCTTSATTTRPAARSRASCGRTTRGSRRCASRSASRGSARCGCCSRTP